MAFMLVVLSDNIFGNFVGKNDQISSLLLTARNSIWDHVFGFGWILALLIQLLNVVIIWIFCLTLLCGDCEDWHMDIGWKHRRVTFDSIFCALLCIRTFRALGPIVLFVVCCPGSPSFERTPYNRWGFRSAYPANVLGIWGALWRLLIRQ